MTDYINGKESKEILLEKLNKTIETNNELTSKQNKLMIKYTQWICYLTVTLILIGIFQLVAIFRK